MSSSLGHSHQCHTPTCPCHRWMESSALPTPHPITPRVPTVCCWLRPEASLPWQPLANASCRHPSCPRVVATATHALLECAQSLPAARWLCDLWAAIDGGGAKPPLHPDVIIAGRTDTWPLHRTKTRLWTLLRLLLLTQIWQAHQRLHSSATPTSPSDIVAAVIRAWNTVVAHGFLDNTHVTRSTCQDMRGVHDGCNM